jgi:hypothetical protein
MLAHIYIPQILGSIRFGNTRVIEITTAVSCHILFQRIYKGCPSDIHQILTHIRPRDVSGESCLTVTNTLVPYILSLIYAVPRVYRLSLTHSLLVYDRKNKPCFSLELSHIQFINYYLHIVDLFHISCHDISIVITSLVIRTNTHLLQY